MSLLGEEYIDFFYNISKEKKEDVTIILSTPTPTFI